VKIILRNEQSENIGSDIRTGIFLLKYIIGIDKCQENKNIFLNVDYCLSIYS